jgi:hypothetical protein
MSWWQDYQSGSALKSYNLNAVLREFGYGGFIHHYKNFVLRQDNSLVPITGKKLTEAEYAVRKYIDLGISDPIEEDAIKQIQNVIKKYTHNFELAETWWTKAVAQMKLIKSLKLMMARCSAPLSY